MEANTTASRSNAGSDLGFIHYSADLKALEGGISATLAIRPPDQLHSELIIAAADPCVSCLVPT